MFTYVTNFFFKEQNKTHNDISDVAGESNKKYHFVSLKWHNCATNTAMVVAKVSCIDGL